MKYQLHILGLATVCIFTSTALSSQGVELGDTRATVIDELGEPMGEATTHGITTLFYSGGGIDLKAGRVIEIAEHFDQRAEYRERVQQYKEQQNAKGLYKYDGAWLTKDQIARQEAYRLRKEAALQAEANAKAAAAARAQRRAAAKQAYAQQQAEQAAAEAQSSGSSSATTSKSPTSSYFTKGGANRGHKLGVTKGSNAHNTRTQQISTE